MGSDLLYQRHIFMHRQRRHQIIKLEHKSHRRCPVFCQLIAGEGGDILAFHQNLPLGGTVQPAQQVQQRAFSGAAGTEDYHKLALLQGHIHMIQCPQLMVTAGIYPAHILKFYDRHV